MYISNIKLWNFRKYGSVAAIDLARPNFSLNFTTGLNVVIGENDSGKSAIIDAIKLVLKTHSYDYIRADDTDFYNRAERFRIELIFSGLEPVEAKNFTEWLAWEGSGVTAMPFLKLIYDVSRTGKRIIPTDVKAGVDDEGYQLTAEARDYLKATYLKPLRDAENELVAKKNSRISQILLGDAAFKNKDYDHELVRIFSDLNGELVKYFKGEAIEVKNAAGLRETLTPQEGKAIKQKIDSYIQSFHGQTNESNFDAVGPDIKNILEKITLSLKGELNPGLGTLNRLFMAAELLHLNKSSWTGIRLGLIEELEAHLHPQAQMQVIEALQKQEKIQLILTTHSPNLASKLKLEHLIICNNGNGFPMGAAYTKLVAEDYRFLEKFLDTTKANLFFAKGVILVEGWAEEILIPSVAKSIGINLTEKGVSVVNIGNLAFQKYASIFLRKAAPHMTIPIAVVTDSDIRAYDKVKGADGKITYTKKDGVAYAAECTAKVALLDAKSEANVKYFVAPEWTLEYTLFKSTSISATFQVSAKKVHKSKKWNADFDEYLAKKLYKKTLKKTEIAYEMANVLDKDISQVEKGVIPAKTIVINPTDATDSINYLVKAIQYAAGN
ncbi:MAG: AAA family ATPase [Bacteroidetes bacterium]|nr:AAA family ATPase [Bacteroidota bacterium]